MAWFAAVVVLSLLATLLVSQQWRAVAAPGDDDSTFVPVTPCRLFDFRSGADNVGVKSTPLGAGEGNRYVQDVVGSNGDCVIPGDAVAVSMNVTIVNPTSQSNLRVFPADVATPNASNLNWLAGQSPTPNKVDVKLSPDGKIRLYNHVGTVNVLADVVGYYTAESLKELAASVGVPGPAGPVGAQGPSGPVGPVNRITDGQIAQLQWYQDPGAAAVYPVGDNPRGMAFDGTNIWVTNLNDNDVSRIDPVTGDRTDFSVGGVPVGVAFDGTNIWVANNFDDDVSRIDPVTGDSIDFSVGNGPVGVAFDGTNIWVTNNLDDDVSRLDPVTGDRIDFSVGNGPFGVAFDGTNIWVTNNFDNDVSRLDPVTGDSIDFSVGTFPRGVAFDGTNIWVTNSFDADVSRLD
ncbi:MAG: YncE family protein, partial [Actinobacteria bacterium]|nr:YncE family protein [Actinomycetota bacterium]